LCCGAFAIFRGAFTIEAAAVFFDERRTVADALESVANLAGKSLVPTDLTGNTIGCSIQPGFMRSKCWLTAARLRRRCVVMPNTTAIYSSGRGSIGKPMRRWLGLPNMATTSTNLRAALDWAFSAGGDANIGLRLTVDAVPLWLQFLLMSECRLRVEQTWPVSGSRQTRMPGCECVSAPTSACRACIRAIRLRKSINPWSTTLALAERLGDSNYQLRGIWGLFAGSINSGNFRAALQFAERFCELASNRSRRPADR
jgi:hypothetical protein